ncbi:hypothetical protein N0V93_007469 [Gnomoniopsis smithogilvyi]|uniref:DAGKc domain-containing protein n=1 Tax=Gnomoniopsis smithogilvyi TaxID=1191159 RepID=A0A9W8YSR5_9PEZI|nr:hypothetical protein N0V93_007469 [Gnomoniopsis smithogilvyi]
MQFDVSSEVLEGLNPLRLPEDAHITERDQEAVITWSTSGEQGKEEAIHERGIVLVAQLKSGEYLVLTLQQGQQDGEEPFLLSAFLASRLPQSLLDQYLVDDLPEYLKIDASSSLDVLVSVRSGTGLAETFFKVILQSLLAVLGLKGQEQHGTDGKSYTVTHTTDANTVKEFAKARWGSSDSPSYFANKSKTVILLSGDGGLVDLLNGTIPSASLPTIALIPLGTGNALFHSLHKPHYTASSKSPSHLVLALRALFKGRAAPLPTFQASFSSGSHLVDNDAPDALGLPVSELSGAIVASYGFHSQLVWESDTPAYRKHGDKRFGMVAAELLKEPHSYQATVETPAGRIGTEDVPFNYVLATMVSNLEKTFTISPASEPLDGQLRLVYFAGATGQRTMEIMTAAYGGGKHVDMDDVGYQAVEQVKVTILEADARWRKVCIDGTIVELPQGGTMLVKKSPESRIQVLVLEA